MLHSCVRIKRLLTYEFTFRLVGIMYWYSYVIQITLNPVTYNQMPTHGQYYLLRYVHDQTTPLPIILFRAQKPPPTFIAYFCGPLASHFHSRHAYAACSLAPNWTIEPAGLVGLDWKLEVFLSHKICTNICVRADKQKVVERGVWWVDLLDLVVGHPEF